MAAQWRLAPPGISPEMFEPFRAACLDEAAKLTPRHKPTAGAERHLHELAGWAWPVFGPERIFDLVVEFRAKLEQEPGAWADLSYALFHEVSLYLEAMEAGRIRTDCPGAAGDTVTRRPPPAPDPPANHVRSQRRVQEERAAAEQRDREAAEAEALLAEFDSLPDEEQADLLQAAWETMPAVARRLVSDAERTDRGNPMVRGSLLEVLQDRRRGEADLVPV